MPSIPKYQKCRELGCNNPKQERSWFCVEHSIRKPKAPVSPDSLAALDSLYKTKQWSVFRRVHLSRFPLCAGCLASGVVTSAAHVDHVFPWKLYGAHAFTQNIFQSLCHSCHSSKTKLEQRGIFRRYGSPTIDHAYGDYQYAIKVQVTD